MKAKHFLSALALVSLTACSSTAPSRSEHSSTETVMVIYYVKPGNEAALQEVLARAWKIYRQEKLVFAEPHTVVQNKENADKPRIIEIFTWVSHDAPDHAPESVKQIWGEMMMLCEPRDGRGPLDGGEVDLLVPSRQ